MGELCEQPVGGGCATVARALGAAAKIDVAKEVREILGEDETGEIEKAQSFVTADEGGGRREIRGLTAKQMRVVELLVGGASIATAVREVGVSRTAYYRWARECPRFVAEINRRRRDRQNTMQRQLEVMTQHAVLAVGQALLDGDPRVGMQFLKGLGFLPGRLAGIGSEDPEVVAAALAPPPPFELRPPTPDERIVQLSYRLVEERLRDMDQACREERRRLEEAEASRYPGEVAAEEGEP